MNIFHDPNSPDGGELYTRAVMARFRPGMRLVQITIEVWLVEKVSKR